MVNENQFNEILLIKNNKNNKMFFGSPLKKLINNMYLKLDIPKESFIISLFYLNNYYIKNKLNKIILDNLFDNINYFFFTAMILSLKQLYDQKINVKDICLIFNIKYTTYIKIEIDLLKSLNWNTSFNNLEYDNFKKFVVRYMDLHLHMDYLNYKPHYYNFLDH